MPKYNIDIEGNLGHDPSTRYTRDGKAVTQFSVAVNDRQQDKETQIWGDVATHWFDITVFGDCPDLHQGDTAHVTAYARTESWIGKDGQPRTKLGFVALSVALVRRKGERLAPRRDDYDLGDLGPPLDMDSEPLSPGD